MCVCGEIPSIPECVCVVGSPDSGRVIVYELVRTRKWVKVKDPAKWMVQKAIGANAME